VVSVEYICCTLIRNKEIDALVSYDLFPHSCLSVVGFLSFIPWDVECLMVSTFHTV
jgi:hypothetical protein